MMEERSFAGDGLMGSPKNPTSLGGDAAPTDIDSSSIDDLLVNSPKEEICRTLCTLVRFGRFEALAPLLKQLAEKKGVEAMGGIIKELDEGGHSVLHWAAKRVDDLRFLQTLIDLLLELKLAALINMPRYVRSKVLLSFLNQTNNQIENAHSPTHSNPQQFR
jgi:hypothetical protein